MERKGVVSRIDVCIGGTWGEGEDSSKEVVLVIRITKIVMNGFYETSCE